MAEKIKYLRFWFPVIIYSGIIFCVSSLPRLQGPSLFENADKVIHTVEYIPLGFFVARALSRSLTHWPLAKVFIFAVIFTCLYGVSDEWHQSFVEGRSSDAMDGLADTVGGIIGSWIFVRFLGKKPYVNSKTV